MGYPVSYFISKINESQLQIFLYKLRIDFSEVILNSIFSFETSIVAPYVPIMPSLFASVLRFFSHLESRTCSQFLLATNFEISVHSEICARFSRTSVRFFLLSSVEMFLLNCRIPRIKFQNLTCQVFLEENAFLKISASKTHIFDIISKRRLLLILKY